MVEADFQELNNPSNTDNAQFPSVWQSLKMKMKIKNDQNVLSHL